MLVHRSPTLDRFLTAYGLHVLGWQYKQIAESLRVAPSNAKRLVDRGRDTLPSLTAPNVGCSLCGRTDGGHDNLTL